MEDDSSGSKHRQLASEEKQPDKTPTYLLMSPPPTWKLTPRDKDSNLLYDSFEFQAVAKQLNRAIHGSNAPMSPYSCYLKSSPFYSKHLNRIWRRRASTPKKISCSQLNGTTNSTKGFIMQLWRKVKRGLVWEK